MKNLATKYDVELVRKETADFRREMEVKIAEVRRDIAEMGMKLTIRLGGMLVVGIGIIAALVKIL